MTILMFILGLLIGISIGALGMRKVLILGITAYMENEEKQLKERQEKRIKEGYKYNDLYNRD